MVVIQSYLLQLYTSIVTHISACDSYDWNGQIIDSSGSYIQTFTNVNACDSVIL